MKCFRAQLVLFLVTVTIPLFFTESQSYTLSPVTLNSPAPSDATSTTFQLSWSISTTPESDFQCYRVLRATSSGFTDFDSLLEAALYSIPTVGPVGAFFLALLILVFARRKILKITAVSLLTLAGIWHIHASAESAVLSDCISSKNTVTYTDTGLTPSTTYYYSVYVLAPDNSYVASEEVYTITYPEDTTAPTTTFNPTAGTYSTPQYVGLSCDDGSGNGCDKTYYTTDGTTPTSSSDAFIAAVYVDTRTEINTFSVDRDGNAESVKTAEYIISSGPSLPTCGAQSTFYTVEPLDPADYIGIAPLGATGPSGHTFPTVHTYMMLTDKTNAAPVYAPGDITITAITEGTVVSESSSDYGATDYVLTFYSCAEVNGYFDHVTTLTSDLLSQVGTFTNCRIYTSGGNDFQICTEDVSISITAGTLLGYAGGSGASSAALDFGQRDTRITPINIINPDRVHSDWPYVVCPYDYFEAGTVYDNLFAKLQVYRTDTPVCGTIDVDIADTAQGKWFLQSTSGLGEDNHLALVPSNDEPTTVGVLSVGNSSVGTDAYYFNWASSGQVNRKFSELSSDGNIYCYDTLREKVDSGSATLLGYLFLQMTDSTNLKLERMDQSASCPSDPNTLSFSSAAVQFNR